MIQFFRFSGPLQVLALVLLILIFRVPMLFTEAPLLWESTYYATISQKIADGAWLYRDVLDSMPPLSGLFFGAVQAFFGGSKVASVLLAGLFILLQALLFNRLCNQNEIVTEKGFIPALMYVLGSFCVYDFAYLSPALLSNTFLLIALHSIFKHIKSENNEGEIFISAAYLGLAYVTLPTGLLYFLLSLLSFVLFTRSTARQYVLYFTGFIFPLLAISTYFYLNNAFYPLWKYFFFSLPNAMYTHSETYLGAVIFILFPVAVITFIGIIRAFSFRRFVIFQSISQRLMLMWLVVIALVVALFYQSFISHFYVILPFVAFFMTHFFHLMSSRKWGNYLLFVFILYSARVSYSYVKWPMVEEDLINFNGQVCEITPQSLPYTGKKVWVIGHNPKWYVHNTLATPFYVWRFTQAEVGNLQTYEQIIIAYNGIINDLPEVIVDEAKLMPTLLSKVPKLKNKYSLVPKSNLYVLVP